MTSPIKRTASVLLVGAIGALSAGFAAPASADDGSWRPPKVDMDMLPDSNGGKSSQDYELKKGCISADDDRRDGDIIPRTPWAQNYLQLDKVHDIMADSETEGKGVDANGDPMTVAVVDTGVREHPWLTVKKGGDYVDAEEDEGPGRNDCDGHGTLVAGIIAADAPSNVNFQGVAPGADIFPVRQSSENYEEDDDKDKDDKDSDKKDKSDKDSKDKEGSGDAGDSEGSDDTDNSDAGDNEPSEGAPDQDKGVGDLGTLARAVKFAAENDAVDVMNISIDNCNTVGKTGGKKMRQLQAAIHWAVNEKDVVVVASAGNADDTCKQNNKHEPNTIVVPPWFDDDVLSVGAIDKNGDVAKFSMHGPWVDVAAPGTEILSLDPAPHTDGLSNQIIQKKTQQEIQGTSYAAPYVSGIATLLRAKDPELDAHEVMQRIENTAQHPAVPDGHNQYVGYGVVNPVAALTTTGAETTSSQENTGPVRAELPDPVERDWTPVVVALAGTGGALVALLITLFTVHTVRRNRNENS